MITLPNMAENITFQEEGHIYSLGSMVIPSVTQIISPLYDFSAINKEVLQYAANRGTDVHYAIEKFIKFGYISKLDTDAQPYFESFMKWFDKKGIKREDCICEIMGYNKTYNYVGTFDLLIFNSKNYDLWDIKTSSVADIKSWAVQLSGYALICKEYGIDIATRNVLQLSPEKAIPYKLKDETGIFLSCLNIHQYKNKKGD